MHNCRIIMHKSDRDGEYIHSFLYGNQKKTYKIKKKKVAKSWISLDYSRDG